MAKQRSAVKTPHKKPHQSIAMIIGMLTHRDREGRLCADGRERLTWWEAHGHEYRDAKQAILSWTPGDIRAYRDYLELAPDYDNLREGLSIALEEVKTFRRYRTTFVTPLTALLRLAHRQARMSMRRWVREQTTVTDWYLPHARW